ncbi:MAG: sigma 54-interacting transcriptional regulator [Sandaracinaceae bacterium]|nr:sigma 54-interacting transcriptional regulator [Sandaracinaceae bacterium]
MAKRTVAFGLVGSTLDAGRAGKRWKRWRPTVALAMQPDLPLDRLELVHQPHSAALAGQLVDDIASVAPDTEVRLHEVPFEDAWDLEEVYGALHALSRDYPFDTSREEYFVHITTGTHVAQICLFLLTEARYFPGRLVQTSPPPRESDDTRGTHRVIDLDLSRYDELARRFAQEARQGQDYLKQGIATQNADFNALVDRIERVAVASREPILFTGPTGAGKSRLAERVYQLKRRRGQLDGPFVAVNCATLRGDMAMGALFGHTKGAFTGAASARPGLLRAADRGVLFLDEIGELGVDEQAMLLRALELKRFFPVGSDAEVQSDFALFAGTNRDLREAVRAGEFREDLLARIDLWTFELPGLADRPEDLEPNLDFELDRAAERLGRRASINREARKRFLAFGRTAPWPANFRDLEAAVLRMATLAPGGRIDTDAVREEIGRLERQWSGAPSRRRGGDRVVAALGAEAADALDRFDRVQLDDVLAVCAEARSISEAGRVLFAASRARKSSTNDADRLRKYLARFGLRFDELTSSRE